MADFTKLHETIAALSAKVDDLLTKVNQPAPPDDQTEVDKAEAEAAAILAKIS